MQLDTNKLRGLIEKKFKTDYRFCKISEIPQSTVSTILSGKNKNPRLCMLARISRALDITIDEMILKPTNEG